MIKWILPFLLSVSLQAIETDYQKMTPEQREMSRKTLVDIALSNPELTTFVAALQAADLISLLQSTGPYTIFAPTNGAFAKLPHGTTDLLMQPQSKERLRSILMYHILPGLLKVEDIKMGTVASLNGRTVILKKFHKDFLVNNARILKPNLMGSNGAVHIIDTVLMP